MSFIPNSPWKGDAKELARGPIGADVLIRVSDLLAWENGLLIPASDSAGLRFGGIAVRYKHTQPSHGLKGDGVLYDNTGGPAGTFDGEGYEPGLQYSKRGKVALRVLGTNPKPGDRVRVVDSRTVTVDATTHDLVVGSLERPYPRQANWWWIDLEDK